MAVSTVSDQDGFWSAMKKAYGRLPGGARWVFAAASVDGTRAVNVIVHDSVEGVREFLAEHTGPSATTDVFEVDAGNAVGLGK